MADRTEKKREKEFLSNSILENNVNPEKISNNNQLHLIRSKDLNIKNSRKSMSIKNNSEFNIDPEYLLMTYFHPDREISEEELSNQLILKIKEESGNLLSPENKIITMNCQGIINPKGRGLKDGLIIFSANDKNPYDIHLNIKNKNDYLSYKYIFAIYFDKITQHYYIRVHPLLQNDKKLLYVRINGDYQLYLFQKEIVILNRCLLEINSAEGYLSINVITGKSDDKIRSNDEYIIHKDTTKLVTIGRDPKCNISFTNNINISRIQCSLIYDDEVEEWILMDGISQKNSKNGTWVLGNHSFEIQSNLMIEILSSKIAFSLEAV